MQINVSFHLLFLCNYKDFVHRNKHKWCQLGTTLPLQKGDAQQNNPGEH